jgi:TonB-linked SusC/RagA family outer membrane protein
MKKFTKIKLILSLLFAINLFTANIYAQTLITGTVLDSKTNEPIPGANVVVEGTTQGTITNLDGKFSISVPDPSTILVISFMGYTSQNVSTEGKTDLSIALVEEAVNLDELVVIGYGTVKKSDLTGSVSVVTSEELNRTPVSNLSNAIQGKASGVVVTQTGTPGGKVNIKIRGVGSITRDTNPLFVIDGIVDADINSILPNDIESFQVLKDASAAAIYGANGSNGVIIITTKRGNSGPAKVSFSAFTSINTIAKQYSLMNADEYSALYNKIALDYSLIPPTAYTDEFREFYHEGNWHTGTNWQDEIIQKSIGQNYYLNVSGGNDQGNYSVSSGYYKENGLLKGSGAERFNLRANSDFKVGKYVKIGETINLTRSIETRPSSHEGDPWQLSLIASPLMNVYNENNKGGYEGPGVPTPYSATDTVINTGGSDKGNPRGPLELGNYQTLTHIVSASMYAEIKPFKWMTFKSTPSVNYSIANQNDWMPAFDMGVRSLPQAKLYSKYGEGTSYSWENQLTFAKSFGKHSFTLTGVNHRRHGTYDDLSVQAYQYNYESLNVISGSDPLQRTGEGHENPWAMNSYLGRLMYDYNSFILFTTSVRSDGSSNFLPEYRWGTFPSFSVAVKIKDLLFENIDQVSSAKVRFGWGKTGNSNIGAFRYSSQIANQNEFSPVFGFPQVIAPAINELNSIGNPVVQWEAAAMTNYGLDFSFFNNSLQFSGEYYKKNNDDLLVEIPVSSAHGRQGKPWVNIGQIENKGFDFDLKYRNLARAFTYSISANLTTIKNEVIDIPSNIFNVVDNPTNITRIGNSIGSFYGYVCEGIIQESDYDETGKYLWAAQSGAKPGDLRFRDLNSDGSITDLDRTIIGKPTPDFTYSLNFDLGYKNFDLTLFLYGMQNYQVYNTLKRDIESFSKQDLDHNKSKDFGQNYWTPENASTEFIRLDPDNSNTNTRFSTWWLEEASFLRIKDLQLGYNLPQSALDKMKMNNLRIYVSGVNLYTFTKYSGRDPESPLNSTADVNNPNPLGAGVDDDAYPLPRTFIMGIQLGF